MRTHTYLLVAAALVLTAVAVPNASAVAPCPSDPVHYALCRAGLNHVSCYADDELSRLECGVILAVYDALP